MSTLATLAVNLTANTAQFQRAMTDAEGVIERVTKGAGLLALGMGALAGAAAIGGLTVAMKGAVDKAADFEQALANTRAATGATATQMAKMRQEAMGIGKDTSKSASEAAAAMGELVKAGVPVETVINGAARSVVQLAEATGSDVTEMAILTSNALNTFKASGIDAAGVANLVAKAANASAISTTDIGFALQMVGPVAAQAGLGMEDFATAVGILGNNALRGSDAGTSLKTMLMRLTAPSKEATKELRNLGVSVFDSQGKTRDFRDILGQLERSLAGASEQQKAATLSTIFGADAIRAANILIGEGVSGWDAFKASMAGAPSIADQARDRLNTLQGQLEMLRGTMDTLAIDIGTALLPALTSIVTGANQGLGWLMSLDWQPAIAGGIALANAIRTLASETLVAAGITFDGSALATLPTVLGAGLTALAGWITTGTPYVVQIVKWLREDIPAGIAALDAAWARLSGPIETFGGHMRTMGLIVKAAAEDGEWLSDWLTHLPTPLAVAMTAVGFAIARFREFGLAMGELVTGKGATSLLEFFTSFPGRVGILIDSIYRQITDGRSVTDDALGLWARSWLALRTGIDTGTDRAVEGLAEMAKRTGAFLTDTAIPAIKRTAVNLAIAVSDWAQDLWNGAEGRRGLRDRLRTLPNDVSAWVTQEAAPAVQRAATNFFTAATSWASGLWDGLGGAKGIKEKLESAVTTISGFVKEKGIPLSVSWHAWALAGIGWAMEIWNGPPGERGLVHKLDDLLKELAGDGKWIKESSKELTKSLMTWSAAFIDWALPENIWSKAGGLQEKLEANKNLITTFQTSVAAPALQGAGAALGEAFGAWLAQFIKDLPGNLQKILDEFVLFAPRLVKAFFEWTKRVQEDWPREVMNLSNAIRDISVGINPLMGVFTFWFSNIGAGFWEGFKKAIVEAFPGLGPLLSGLPVTGGGSAPSKPPAAPSTPSTPGASAGTTPGKGADPTGIIANALEATRALRNMSLTGLTAGDLRNRIATTQSALSDLVGQLNAAGRGAEASALNRFAGEGLSSVKDILRNLADSAVVVKAVAYDVHAGITNTWDNFVAGKGAIPALARGGIATVPTMALVGERGPEAIIPLDRLTDYFDRLATVIMTAIPVAARDSAAKLTALATAVSGVKDAVLAGNEALASAAVQIRDRVGPAQTTVVAAIAAAGAEIVAAIGRFAAPNSGGVPTPGSITTPPSGSAPTIPTAPTFATSSPALPPAFATSSPPMPPTFATSSPALPTGLALTLPTPPRFTMADNGFGIPALARGGLVTSPTLATIGERGPEAVIPLNRFAEAVRAAGLKGDRQPLVGQIVIHANSEAEGRAAGRGFLGELRRHGYAA